MRYLRVLVAAAVLFAAIGTATGQVVSITDLRGRAALGAGEVERIVQWLEEPVRMLTASGNPSEVVRARKRILGAAKRIRNDTEQFHQAFRKEAVRMIDANGERAARTNLNWLNTTVVLPGLGSPDAVPLLAKALGHSFAPCRYWGARGLAKVIATIGSGAHKDKKRIAVKAIASALGKETEPLVISLLVRALAEVRSEEGHQALALAVIKLASRVDMSDAGTAGALIVAVKGLKTAYGKAVQTVAKKRIMLALATLVKRIDAGDDSPKLLAAVNLALEQSTGKKTKLGALIKSKAAAAEVKREQRKWVAILLQAKLIDKPPL